MASFHKQTTAPAASPVSTAEIKAHLRIDASDEDTLLDAYVAAAVRVAERYLARQLITATWTMRLDRFPGSRIYLPPAPLQSVTSLKYYDADGDLQTLDSSYYVVVTGDEPGFLYLADGKTWPSTDTRPDAVVVAYVCGYGDAGSDVPADVRTALKVLAGYYYNNRECGEESLPRSVKCLLGDRAPWTPSDPATGYGS